eukprot:CAMPEP_0113303666 /NCGR_PEP_ID=MMETSP0010_2-20120614/3989_1 /TAXON_ID=216773 ORGANISM="Corethron hystrix, Strain 308" /NCGR_SAMPLE_ID=MMETSP0010_2 /ASSEMBLY_ACC=CAM_ASM_000155 /LENGTH=611 /DNA_ID=CAMNT_0000157705 /DNA_START=415 /DNA_END=2247 /DNA_ORIENTATION=+ /assembly_acc=CAM_ASM_000155
MTSSESNLSHTNEKQRCGISSCTQGDDCIRNLWVDEVHNSEIADPTLFYRASSHLGSQVDIDDLLVLMYSDVVTIHRDPSLDSSDYPTASLTEFPVDHREEVESPAPSSKNACTNCENNTLLLLSEPVSVSANKNASYQSSSVFSDNSESKDINTENENSYEKSSTVSGNTVKSVCSTIDTSVSSDDYNEKTVRRRNVRSAEELIEPESRDEQDVRVEESNERLDDEGDIKKNEAELEESRLRVEKEGRECFEKGKRTDEVREEPTYEGREVELEDVKRESYDYQDELKGISVQQKHSPPSIKGGGRLERVEKIVKEKPFEKEKHGCGLIEHDALKKDSQIFENMPKSMEEKKHMFELISEYRSGMQRSTCDSLKEHEKQKLVSFVYGRSLQNSSEEKRPGLLKAKETENEATIRESKKSPSELSSQNSDIDGQSKKHVLEKKTEPSQIQLLKYNGLLKLSALSQPFFDPIAHRIRNNNCAENTRCQRPVIKCKPLEENPIKLDVDSLNKCKSLEENPIAFNGNSFNIEQYHPFSCTGFTRKDLNIHSFDSTISKKMSDQSRDDDNYSTSDTFHLEENKQTKCKFWSFLDFELGKFGLLEDSFFTEAPSSK